MKGIIKNIFSFIVSMITVIMIFIMSITLLLDKVILNEKTYTKILEDKKISKQVESYIYNNLDNLLTLNKLPAKTLDGVISLSEIESRLHEYVDFTVEFMKNRSGEISSLDMDTYEKRILKKANLLTEEQQKRLINIKESVLNIINNSLKVINLSGLYKSSIVEVIMIMWEIVSYNNFSKMIILNIVLLTMSHFFIWRKNKKYKRQVWVPYPFICGGTLVFMVGISGYLSQFYGSLNIDVEYIKIISTSIMNTYFLKFGFIGIIFITIGMWMRLIYKKRLLKI